MESCTKYEEMAKSLIEAINSKKEIEAFIKNVDLINFLNLLGKIIDNMNDISHKLFPELSNKYRITNYNTTEEEVKTNIKLCMRAFGEYVNKKFDLLTKFFNEYYQFLKYTKYNKNYEKGNKQYFFDAMKK